MARLQCLAARHCLVVGAWQQRSPTCFALARREGVASEMSPYGAASSRLRYSTESILEPDDCISQSDWRCATRGGGRPLSAYRESMVAKSPVLGLIHTWQSSMAGALALLVVSANCAHLRIWEVGGGNFPPNLCGVLVRESGAANLAEALWGAHQRVYPADPLICNRSPKRRTGAGAPLMHRDPVPHTGNRDPRRDHEQ